jgi:hypothetical protein
VLFTSIGVSAQVSENEGDYFQQRVDYSIATILDHKKHELHANMEIWYTNNSPDILEEIHFNVWANAYSQVNTPMGKQLRQMGSLDFQYCTPDEMGGIDSLSFNVNGSPVEHAVMDEFGEHVRLTLPEPLLPNDSVRIITPFRLKIPSGAFSRLGHVGSSYQLTQWYPKPAVYDKDGWHVMPYLTQGEFYSEFGSFEVSMMLDNSFFVGATGRMSDNQRMSLTERAKSTAIISEFPDNSFPGGTRFVKNISFKQDSIHDFAMFMDRRFNVLHDTIVLPHSGRVVDAWVLFTNNNTDQWTKSMEYVKEGTRFYSQHVGDYPYDHITVVDGTISAGGGMEYPMITVINSTGSDRQLEKVIVHEIGHNWFYGILGSNEREEAWMDEGINSFYEVRYFEEKYGEDTEYSGLLSEVVPDSRGLNELGYLFTAREHMDQELHICAHRYTPTNYGVMVYSKGAYMMQYLRSVMGTELFDSSMKHYYEKWKYRHPSPADLEQALEEHSGMNLDWFFKELIPTRKKIDFKVDSYDQETNKVLVKSKTSYEGPLTVGYYKNDELLGTQVIISSVETSASVTDFDRIMIDPHRDMLEMNRKNDTYKVNGLLKRTSNFGLRRLSRPGDSPDRLVFYNPMSLWNDNDKLMFGVNLTNFEALAKDFEWSITPMWSFNQKELVGLGNLRKKIWFAEDSPNRLSLGVEGKRFSIYDKDRNPGTYLTVKPEARLTIIPKSLKNGRFELGYTAHYVVEDFVNAESGLTSRNENTYHVVDYVYDYSKGLFKTGVNAEFEYHEDFKKVQLDIENRLVYNRLNKMIGARLYAGHFWRTGDFSGATAPALAGQTGIEGQRNGDYRYDHLFLGRSTTSGLLSQQHVRNRGGFSIATPFSGNWAASVNIFADLPVPLPLTAYFSAGVNEVAGGNLPEARTEFIYESGIRISVIRDYLDVSFPLFLAPEITEAYELADFSYGQRIMFQIRLEEIKFRENIFKAAFK